MTDEEKADIVRRFQEKFNIIALSSEILAKTTYPAKKNNVYEATLKSFVLSKTRYGKQIAKIEFVTDNREKLEAYLNAEFPYTEVLSLQASLGVCSPTPTADSLASFVGKKYRVYYGNGYDTLRVLERL